MVYIFAEEAFDIVLAYRRLFEILIVDVYGSTICAIGETLRVRIGYIAQGQEEKLFTIENKREIRPLTEWSKDFEGRETYHKEYTVFYCSKEIFSFDVSDVGAT